MSQRALRAGAAAAMLAIHPISGALGADLWVAYPARGGLAAARIAEPGGEISVYTVDEEETAGCPPALCLDCNGYPAIAWLDAKRNILFSAFDGRGWSPAEMICPSSGRHRGIPSIAACGKVVAAWAEAADGGFEDIFYSIRLKDGWSAPSRAHEANVVPDIMPETSVDSTGSFSISWKSFDGERYVERRAGEALAAPAPATPPEAAISAALDERMPPGAVLSWQGFGFASGSAPVRKIKEEYSGTYGPGAGEPPLSDSPSVKSSASAAPPIRIIAFGDSITYGRGSSSNGPRTGYPAILQRILEYDYPGREFQIYNEGNPGEQTYQGLGRFTSVLDQHPADVVLIMEGTNDIYFQVSFQTIQQNLRQMVQRAFDRGVYPILATIIPTVPGSRPEQYSRTRSFYNGGYVQAVCNYYGLPCANQWSAFCGIPNFGSAIMDRATGNHPNDNGYRYVMAPEWYETMAPLIDIPFVPMAPVLTVEESAQDLSRGDSEYFSYHLSPSNDYVENGVDCYAALAAPNGRLYFVDSKKRFTLSAVPMIQRAQLDEAPPDGSLLDLPIGLNYPVGAYTLYVATVRCLRDPWPASNRSSMTQISFEVR